jgi:hypothetical protein
LCVYFKGTTSAGPLTSTSPSGIFMLFQIASLLKLFDKGKIFISKINFLLIFKLSFNGKVYTCWKNI